MAKDFKGSVDEVEKLITTTNAPGSEYLPKVFRYKGANGGQN